METEGLPSARGDPQQDHLLVKAVSSDTQGLDSEKPSVSSNGRFVLMESEGTRRNNSDHNREIFEYDTKAYDLPSDQTVGVESLGRRRRPGSRCCSTRPGTS